MKAIVGLGNPGPKYDRTRHNAGFWAIDALGTKVGASDIKGHTPEAQVRRGSWNGVDLVLVKPLTFMNNSGRAVRGVMDREGLVPEEILLIYDDLALEPGVIRLRTKGSAGGHNGVKSVISYLGTESFPRLRIGIGAVPASARGIDYVLGVPSREERELIDQAVSAAAEAALAWALEGPEQAMSRYNRAWAGE